MKTDTDPKLLWAKRLLIYVLGLYLMAIGVVFSSRSALGVSPVSSLGNVLYQIGSSAGAPSFVNLGNCTTAVFCLYLLAEFLVLRRDFRPAMLLQVAASLLFGQLVNLASGMLSFLPAPGSYPLQLIYLLISVPLVAAGVMLYLSPNILAMPGEGLCLAISRKSGLAMGTVKTIFDCAVVALSAAASLLYFRGLVGVREGTVICALLVGFVFKLFQKPFQKPLLRFVERETKVERALEAASQGYLTDTSGNPKIIITIGREFGSGGMEIGRRLAERLGITFYDGQIDELAAEQSGLPLEKVREMSRHRERAAFSDLRSAVYEMSNDALSPEDLLYVAQASAIRQIAAGGESCVILGRCADYVLYDDPNCFRIFVHARPDIRVKRTMAMFGLSQEEAVREMENTDRARGQYYKRYTGREYGAQKYYHLGLDSGLLGTEESVESIIGILRRWCDVRGTHPLYMR
jgi:uncharacterized membrane protein YczE/cytidylate kinase